MLLKQYCGRDEYHILVSIFTHKNVDIMMGFTQDGDIMFFYKTIPKKLKFNFNI
jgi:hypothetical protein